MRTDDLGKLLLRVALGVMILLHGLAKIGSGPGGVAGLLRGHGLPGGLAWAVYIGEVLAPVLMIVGIWTRGAAAVVAINMMVAIYLAHWGELFSLGRSGGWAIELQGMYLVAALVVLLLGAGRVSLGGAGGRLN